MRQTLMTMILALTLGATAAQAQDDLYGTPNTKEQRAQTRKQRKAEQAHTDSILAAEAIQAVRDTAFTLEADQVVFKDGSMAMVNSNTNFVSVCGDRAVVQIAFNVPWPTPNGIGGVTLLGTVQKMQVQTDRRGTTLIRMNVVGVGISAQVVITIYPKSNKASVDVLPNFNSRRITLRGTLLPASKSTVYQGWGI